MINSLPIVKSNVNKVVIVPYHDSLFQKRSTSVPFFVLPINPETYSRSYKIENNTTTNSNKCGSETKYKSTRPEQLQLEFIFDSTNTIEGYIYNTNTPSGVVQKLSTEAQIDLFLKTVYQVEGEIHRPNYLKIYWGSLIFECVLDKLDINYTLINEAGFPIRAKANATFTAHIHPEKEAAAKNEKSPDVTHQHRVQQGDRLDLIVDKIYNSGQYLLQVASANDLTSIRSLPIGKEIILPPINN